MCGEVEEIGRVVWYHLFFVSVFFLFFIFNFFIFPFIIIIINLLPVKNGKDGVYKRKRKKSTKI